MAITRRRLIESGAAATAAGAVAATPAVAAKHTRPRKKADVIVVGAGLAGLTAARNVLKGGHSVIVMEAANRVGGRTLNEDIGGGEIADLGGTFVGPTQDHVLALIKELGIPTFPTYNTGDNVFIRTDGRRETFASDGPTGTAPADPELLPDLVLAVQQLDSMAAELDVNKPWAHPRAAEWDSQTLDSWIKQNSSGNKEFLDLVAAACEPIFGAEPREISLLYTLFYIASSGNEQNVGTFERNFNTQGGGQETRIEGGAQLISIKMAQQLGRRVIKNAPVRRIDQGRFGVRVWTDKYYVQGKRVIVAMPPATAGRIVYHGGMTDLRDQLMQRIPQGTLRKFDAVYDTPFWREKNLSGQCISNIGPVTVTFDASPKGGNPGVVLGFIGGTQARTWTPKPAEERKAAVLKQFQQFFDDDRALQPKSVVEKDWPADPWCKGCPVGVLPPGTLIDFGPTLRAPLGKIHWAGTETSDYWCGYMDGAVRSGERAATEVLAEV